MSMLSRRETKKTFVEIHCLRILKKSPQPIEQKPAKSAGLAAISVTRDRCYDFLNILDEKNCKKLAFFAQTTASFCKNCDHNIGF
jgi:hypothetical protein